VLVIAVSTAAAKRFVATAPEELFSFIAIMVVAAV